MWSASATSETNNETFDFRLYKNAIAVPGSGMRRKFGTGGDYGAWAKNMPHVAIVAGDKISLALANQDTVGNITMRDLTVKVDTL